VFRHEQFCPPDLTVGDRADDLDDPAGGQVDLDDRAFATCTCGGGWSSV
jgi:hypothetical protein